MKKLRERWGIQNNFSIVVIFVVFAINGSLSARISVALLQLMGIHKSTTDWYLYYPLLIILVLPLYPFLLMVFGWLFGQSRFFFPFAKKMLAGIGLGFVFRKR